MLPLLWLFIVMSCRSTLETKPNFSLQASAVPSGKMQSLALGEGYSCILNKKGQGQCLGMDAKGAEAPSSWKFLVAAANPPVLRHLVARATVVCAVGMEPPSLANRILCWQPQNISTSGQAQHKVILLSAKMPSPIRSLSLQKDKVCALLATGQVGCGELASNEQALVINVVKGLGSIRQLRSGDSFSCAVRRDNGKIFCWGDNSAGQLGLDSSQGVVTEPVEIAKFPGRASSVETGTQHACAINQAGEVLCWGSNSDQQLCVEDEKFPEPKLVRGLPAKAEALALGARHSCAQLVDGSVFCWGHREALGADISGPFIPVRVPLPTTSSQLVAGPDRTCSQLTAGEYYCWGIEPEIFSVP